MTIKSFLSMGVSGVEEYKEAVKTGRIDEYRGEHTTEATDSLTERIRGVYRVKPFAVTKSQYLIICPLCRGIHAHGKTSGHRVAHCDNEHGYFIEEADEIIYTKTGGAE